MIAHEDASPRREEKETSLLRGVSRMNGGVEFQEWKARIARRNRRRVEDDLHHDRGNEVYGIPPRGREDSNLGTI